MRSSIAGRPSLTKERGLSDDQWRYMAKSLEELARLCAEYELELCFHSHGGTYVENPDEIHRLCDLTDESLVKLCLDTGHIAFGGGDPVELFRAYASRIGHVHLKDIRLDLLKQRLENGDDYATAAKSDVFVALGQGNIDIRKIIETLQGAGYKGWIIVEQDRVLRPDDDSIAAAVTSRQYLRDNFGV